MILFDNMLALSFWLSLEFDLSYECTSETELCSVISGKSSINLCFSIISLTLASYVPGTTPFVSFLSCSYSLSCSSRSLACLISYSFFCSCYSLRSRSSCLSLISSSYSCACSRKESLRLFLSCSSCDVCTLPELRWGVSTLGELLSLIPLFWPKRLSSLREKSNFLRAGSVTGVHLRLSRWSCSPLPSFLS